MTRHHVDPALIYHWQEIFFLTLTLDSHMQFRWQFLLRKFDTLSEKEMEMMKTQICDEKQKKMPKKYIKVLSNIFFMN